MKSLSWLMPLMLVVPLGLADQVVSYNNHCSHTMAGTL